MTLVHMDCRPCIPLGSAAHARGYLWWCSAHPGAQWHHVGLSSQPCAPTLFSTIWLWLFSRSLVKCQVNLKMMLHSPDIFIQDVTALKGIKEDRVADRPVTGK